MSRPRWRALVLVMVFLSAGVSATLVGVLVGGGPSPRDWDPTASCRAHGGIKQIVGDHYTSAAVCSDGIYRSNPYD